MEYIGEHLFPGYLGHFFAVLSFVAALFSAYAFFKATQLRATPDTKSWVLLGRGSFMLHGVATFSIIGVLFYILTGRMYEYHYAWANVSNDLPFQYIFSSFWKEQQGSFLLWSFWHIILGVVFMFKGGKFSSPVLAVIALAEAIIASMVLGLYFGDFRLGASPFDLLRETMDAPIFQQADYLTKINGQGLNPLLQNYWMTIHPPTLFLGFASTIIPFAFAIAGLWTREHKEWLRPALQWSLFSATILGTGILMGGAWAYEALSFAGYWAWDPVENSSLVPWITLVAGIHTNLVARNTGYSIKSTYFFYLITFLLILFSTYLTRSGILGETSAHAFTEMGLSFQLLLFIGGFGLMGLTLFIARFRGIPSIKEEEKLSSREFWMFMGSLVLLLSAILITGATSLPVYNKIIQLFGIDQIQAVAESKGILNTVFGGKLALKVPMDHHNRYQLWIAVFIGVLTGIAQWLRYAERNWGMWSKKVALHLGIALVAAAVLSYLNGLWIEIPTPAMWAMLFAGMFSVVANADYIFTVGKGSLKLAASPISHIGFGILVLGILSTGLGKRWISSNEFAMEGLIKGMDKDELSKNIMLLKDAPMPIRDQVEATYLRDTFERQIRTFVVQFNKKNKDGDPTGETFTLYPNVMYDRQFSKVVASNPSTQHYWNYDIFTHVRALPEAELDPEVAKAQEDSLKYAKYDALVGDTIFTKKHYVIVEGLTKQPKHPDYQAKEGDLAFGLQLRAYSLDDPKGVALEPMMYLRPESGGFSLAATASKLQMKVKLTDAAMERIFKTDDELRDQHQAFDMAKGEVVEYKGYKVKLKDLLTKDNVRNPNYVPKDGDIAVAADLEVVTPAGKTLTMSPVYVIRDSRNYSLKDEVPTEGLHVRFDKIDPGTGKMTISLAKASEEQRLIPIEIAENAARGDYIVLEAIVFPGINLVWIGCILMIIGLAIAGWRRYVERNMDRRS